MNNWLKRRYQARVYIAEWGKINNAQRKIDEIIGKRLKKSGKSCQLKSNSSPPSPSKKNRNDFNLYLPPGQPQAGWYYAYTYFYGKKTTAKIANCEITAWEFLIF